MIIKKRVNKVDKYLQFVENHKFCFLTKTKDEELLRKIGFKGLNKGEKIVPNPIGSVTRFNINGKEEIKVPIEYELVDHEIEYNIVDWHGNPQSGTYTRTFRRKKRVFVPAPKTEISIISKTDCYEISTNMFNSSYDKEVIKHTLNLMLEIFKSVDVFDENYKSFTTTKMVPWEILPPGEMPWDKFYDATKNKMKKYSSKQVDMIKERYTFLENLDYKNIMIGKKGFSGYFIVEFENEMVICDSVFLGNAAYVFKTKWEELSQMTKSEIIKNHLSEARIIHNGNWKEKILSVLNKNK